MLGDRTSGSFTPMTLRTLLKEKKPMADKGVVKTSSGVTVQKPFWMSKKYILTALALGIATYQGFTGQWENLTPEQLAAKIAETATWLGPIITMVLALAHVDGKTQGAALLGDALKVLASLDDVDEEKPGDSTTRPS